MRCLKCWKSIDGPTAVYTKSCQHVFCMKCSEAAFKKDLSCPLCDTVLTKDGTAKMVVKPDEACVSNSASTMFGFEPQQICETFQKAVQFWATQKHNEGIKHGEDMANLRKKLSDAQMQNANMLKVLEDERLKKKSLQNEKDSLKTLVSELETRYAEKARALRKLSELYNELRQVHRRLEQDLRGVRDMELPNPVLDGQTAEAAGKFTVDVQTNVRSDNAERISEMEIRTDAYANDQIAPRNRRAGVVEGQEYEKDQGRYEDHGKERNRGTRGERGITREYGPYLRETIRLRSDHVRDNDYLGLHDAHQLEVPTATERSPDMFCLAPLDKDEEREDGGSGRHRNRSVHRRDGRRSSGHPDDYQKREAHVRRTSLDKRGR